MTHVLDPQKVLSFFGLEQQPFSLTPNTSLYYGLPPHEQALETLHSALCNGEGFIKVTGEVGTGKTMVLRLFMSELGDDYELIYIPNPVLTPDELRVSIARELSIDVENYTNLSLIDDINHRLLALNRAHKHVVLVIDEAQALPDNTLETIRLLGNLETEHTKMLQIVLFGQPELDQRLELKEFRQLKQRFSFSYCLRALDFDETYCYLNYRMRAAGFKGGEFFPKSVAKKLFRATHGVPRLINVLAVKCVMLAYGKGVYLVDNSIVYEAILDSQTSLANSQLNSVDICLISMAVIMLLLTVAVLIFMNWGIL